MNKILTKPLIDSFFENLQSEQKKSREIAAYRRVIIGLQQIAAQHDNVLDRSVLQEWKATQEKSGIAPGTMTNRIVQMNRFLRYVGCEDLCFPKGGRLDLTGKRFGNLVVMERVQRKSADRSIYWKCRCLSCGQEKEIPANQLTRGVQVSCGCNRKNRLKNTNGYIEDTCLKSVLSKKISKNNTSGVKGVFRKRGKWAASIQYKKKNYYLGSFDYLQDAVVARKQAEEWVRRDAEKLMNKWKEDENKREK